MSEYVRRRTQELVSSGYKREQLAKLLATLEEIAFFDKADELIKRAKGE